MRHPTSRVLFSYWDGLRGERAAPERGEIEPGAIRHILADTFIVETDQDEPTLRLAGTRLCALFGRELRGEGFVSLWAEAHRADMRNQIEAVMGDAAGIVGGLSGRTDTGEEIMLEIVLLPLRHHGKTHSRLIGAISPATIPVWLGAKPVTSLRTASLRVIWPVGRAAEPAPAPGIERRRRLVIHQGGRV